MTRTAPSPSRCPRFPPKAWRNISRHDLTVQPVDHRLCLPVFFRWLHFRQPRRQQPHVAAHSSDHRIGSGLRPRDRRPFVGARHPLRPRFARSSSAGHRWPAARDTSWLTLITSSGRHIMRRSASTTDRDETRTEAHRSAVPVRLELEPSQGLVRLRNLQSGIRGSGCGLPPVTWTHRL